MIFLAAAEILDPKVERTLASLVLDRGWHTFPVELIDGRPYVVNLDPMGPPHNAMLAAAYKAGKISPIASQNLVPWFGQVARNACGDDGYEECYDYAIDSLRNAMMTGARVPDDMEDIERMCSIGRSRTPRYSAGRATPRRARWSAAFAISSAQGANSGSSCELSSRNLEQGGRRKWLQRPSRPRWSPTTARPPGWRSMVSRWL